MKVNKELIIENLISEIKDGILLVYYKFGSEDNKLNMDKNLRFLKECDIIDLICDETNKKVLYLTEKETYILRKRLGIFDDGIVQSYKEIDESLEKPICASKINQILSKDYRFIMHYNYKRYNKSDLSNNNILNDTLDKLGLSVRSYNCLRRNGLNKVQDLVKLRKDDLMSFYYLGKVCSKEVIDTVHNYGLLFAYEELEQLESNDDITSTNILDARLDNLNLSVRPYNCLRRVGINTVRDLTKLNKDDLIKIRNISKYGALEITTVVHKEGLFFADEDPKLETFNQFESQDNITNINILNSNLNSLDLSVRPYNCLRRVGINTVKDLIKLNKDDLIKIRNMGPCGIKEIIYIVHDKGLFFADEISLMKMYSNEIYTQLSCELNSELVQKYQELVNTREKLKIKSKELDMEISILMDKIRDNNEVKSEQSIKK